MWGFGEWRHLAGTKELSEQIDGETICCHQLSGLYNSAK